MLPVRAGEIKLLSISFDADDGEPRYANFWAVDQRFVMVNFDRSIRNVRLVQNIDVLRIRRSWRSNIE